MASSLSRSHHGDVSPESIPGIVAREGVFVLPALVAIAVLTAWLAYISIPRSQSRAQTCIFASLGIIAIIVLFLVLRWL
jgi:hypothetical protein